MAAYFGLKAKPLTGDEPNELETKVRQPSPRNGTESTLKNRIVMSKWATQPEVKDAWLRLQKKHNLQPNVFEKTWWPLLDFLFGIQWACSMSMSKAREFGVRPVDPCLLGLTFRAGSSLDAAILLKHTWTCLKKRRRGRSCHQEVQLELY